MENASSVSFVSRQFCSSVKFSFVEFSIQLIAFLLERKLFRFASFRDVTRAFICGATRAEHVLIGDFSSSQCQKRCHNMTARADTQMINHYGKHLSRSEMLQWAFFLFFFSIIHSQCHGILSHVIIRLADDDLCFIRIHRLVLLLCSKSEK